MARDHINAMRPTAPIVFWADLSDRSSPLPIHIAQSRDLSNKFFPWTGIVFTKARVYFAFFLTTTAISKLPSR